MASRTSRTVLIVLGSAIGGVVLFVLVIVGIAYFAGDRRGIEESQWFHDPEQHAAFIEALRVANVPFRIGPGGAVFYQIQHKQQVAKVAEVTRNQFVPAYSVIRITREQLEAAQADFKRHGVEFKALDFESGYLVRWGREDNSKVQAFLKTAPYYDQGPAGE